MMHPKNVLKTSLQDILKMCWRCIEDIFKTSSKRLEDFLKTFLEDVLKISWRRFCKTSWRHLKDVLKTSWRPMTKTNILVLIKTSWRHLEYVFWKQRRKTSSSLLQDIFIRMNVCWAGISCSVFILFVAAFIIIYGLLCFTITNQKLIIDVFYYRCTT